MGAETIWPEAARRQPGMTQSYQAGRSVAELGAKQPHDPPPMLGGVLAILLAAAIYGIPSATPPGIPANQLTNVVTIVVVNVVLGGSLWVAAAMTRKNLMNGAIVAGVIGVLLAYYGGAPGQIGGIVGVLGAILAAAKPHLPWSRRGPREQGQPAPIARRLPPSGGLTRG